MSFVNIINLLGGLGLFLFGMKYMSEGLNQVAGKKMKEVLGVDVTVKCKVDEWQQEMMNQQQELMNDDNDMVEQEDKDQRD